MCRRQQLNEVKHCNGINGESVTAQHRVLVLDWKINCSKRRILEQVTPKIKWWRLKEENLKNQFMEKVLSERRLFENVQEWWEENSTVIHSESWTGGAWCDNRKEASWGQGDMVVER